MLDSKTALIVGATGGLGSEIARQLHSSGCTLILTGRNERKLQKLKKELGTSVTVVVADITQSEDLENLCELDVDILVNSAGVFPMKNILNSTVEDFDRCFAINVRAPFVLASKLGVKMAGKGWGRIVNIGSSSSYNGSADTGIYCASKHALLGLGRSLYLELKEKGVRCYTISPGSIQTPMGATDTRQDYQTFINPSEIAEYTSFILGFENEMISEEIRLNRFTIR